MSTPKTRKVEIFEECFLPISGELVEDPYFQKFADIAGGELATAIFKGEFQSKLYLYLNIAQVRGKLAYHRDLLKKDDEKKKVRRAIKK